jgi:hypothetical protein
MGETDEERPIIVMRVAGKHRRYPPRHALQSVFTPRRPRQNAEASNTTSALLTNDPRQLGLEPSSVDIDCEHCIPLIAGEVLLCQDLYPSQEQFAVLGEVGQVRF